MDKIIIPLDNGYKLIAEQNSHSEFNQELFVGIENESGLYIQDLVVVRPSYEIKNDKVIFNPKQFEMLVFSDNKTEDFTHSFTVPVVEDEQ